MRWYRPRSICTLPPTEFTAATSFTSTCDVDYCVSTLTDSKVVLSAEGEVTAREYEAALGVLYGYKAVTSLEGAGNVLAYGHAAQAAYGAGLLYQMSADKRALDLMVRFADNSVALKNKHIVLWTGKVAPIWVDPSANLTTTRPTSEQGAIVAHIANAAYGILRTPCIYNLVPPVQAGYPTPFPSGTTYLTRAKSYLQAGYAVYDSYFSQFFDESNLLIQPDDQRWNPADVDGVQAPGSPMPWNRRMMVVHGMVRLAQATELLSEELRSQERIDDYDAKIAANIVDFLASLNRTTSAVGTPTYFWRYGNRFNGPEEAEGLHGRYDVFGLFLAWQRTPSLASDDVMTTFVNTFQDSIFDSKTKLFAGFVDGTSSDNKAEGKAVAKPQLSGAEWAYYGWWREEWYRTMLNSGSMSKFSDSSIQLIWIKHGLNVNADTFWRGFVSSEVTGGQTTEPDFILSAFPRNSSESGAILWGCLAFALGYLAVLVVAMYKSWAFRTIRRPPRKENDPLALAEEKNGRTSGQKWEEP